MKRIYVDSETTGTDPQQHALIQFSAVISVDGVAKEELNLAIRPIEGKVIEDTALEVNGITREELFAADRITPRDAHLVITKLLAKYVNKYDKKDKFIWLGYRAGFDSDFTRKFFDDNGDTYFGSWFFTPPLCVMTLAAYLLQKQRSNLENFKLRTVYNYLYPDNTFTDEDWHDSLFDIYRTIDIEDALRDIVRPPQPQLSSR